MDALGKQSHDHEIAAYAQRTRRHVLTSDDDFYRQIDEGLPTLFFLPDQRLSVHRIATIIDAIEEQYPGDELEEQPAVTVVEGWL